MTCDRYTQCIKAYGFGQIRWILIARLKLYGN